MYTSQLGYDLAVTRISHLVQRAPNADWKLAMNHSAGNCVLCIALEGEAIYLLEGAREEKMHIRGGDLLFFLPGTKRRAHSMPEKPWQFITVVFDLICYSPQAQQQLRQLPCLIRQAPGAVRNMFMELDSIWMGKRPGYILRCRSIIEQILCALIQLAETSDVDSAHYENIECIRQYIQEHYAQSFTIEALAQMARYSPSHFRMLFRQVVGMTAVQYQAMVRIEKAKDLLLSGEMNVSEAAAHLGYRDIYYFSRQFKQLTGKSPREYMR